MHKVSVQLVPKYFSRDCSTDSISCSERKKPEIFLNKTANQERKIQTLLSSPIHLADHRSAVAPLSHRYCSAVAPLSLLCRSVVAPLSHCYRSAVSPPLLLRCRAAFAPLSHRYRSTVAPLMLLLLSLRSRTTIAPLFRHCRSASFTSAVATQSLLLSPPLSLRCRAVVAPLLLFYSFCFSVGAAVASAVTTVSLMLSLLLSLMVVSSRGRIRVTVFIGVCQTRVSSSSEGCLNS